MGWRDSALAQFALAQRFIASRAVVAAPVVNEEIALADTRRMSAYGFTTYTYNLDQLSSRRGLQIYSQMRQDEQVKSCLRLVKSTILGPGWDLIPQTDDDGEQALADQLTEDLLALPGTLEDNLYEILSALDYGFSLTEVLWELRDGKVVLGALKTRAPHDFQFEMDGFGNVFKVRQLATELDYANFLHFVVEPEFSNPHGTSELRAAYNPWFLKTNFLQFEAIFMEKLADSPIIATHPSGTPAEKVQTVLNVINNMQAKTGMTLPEGWKIELLESHKTVHDVFVATINHQDVRIAKALLVPDKIGFSGGEVRGGSYALAQTQFDVYLLAQQLVGKRLDAVFQQKIIAPMAQLYAPNLPPPRFQRKPVTEENKVSIAELWLKAVVGNAVLSDVRDENHLREQLGFPTVEETNEQLRDAILSHRQTTVAVPGVPDGGIGGPSHGSNTTPQSTAGNDSGSAVPSTGGKPSADPGAGTSGNRNYMERGGDCAQHADIAARGDQRFAVTVPETIEAEPDDALPPTSTFWRSLTPGEERADMAEKRRLQDTLVGPLAKALGAGVMALVADIRSRVEREGLGLPNTKPQAVQSLAAKNTTRMALVRAVQAILRDAYNQGGTDASAELQRARAQMTDRRRGRGRPKTYSVDRVDFAQRIGILGQQAERFFAAKAMYVTGVMEDDVLKRAKATLFASLRGDKTQRQVLFELDQDLADFLPAEDAQGNIVNVPARLETIARTNIAEAFGEGRWATLTDPDIADFIDALTYTAVMDDRTRENHAAWDGVTLPVDFWPGPPDRRPPNGFNCRCTVVPVTAADTTELTNEADLPLDQPLPDPGFR